MRVFWIQERVCTDRSRESLEHSRIWCYVRIHRLTVRSSGKFMMMTLDLELRILNLEFARPCVRIFELDFPISTPVVLR